jgi:hypothetical protein
MTFHPPDSLHSGICARCGDPWTNDHVCESGMQLAQERMAAGLTRPQVAAAWVTTDHPNGVSKGYIYHLERQTHPLLRARTLHRAAVERAKQ